MASSVNVPFTSGQTDEPPVGDTLVATPRVGTKITPSSDTALCLAPGTCVKVHLARTYLSGS